MNRFLLTKICVSLLVVTFFQLNIHGYAIDSTSEEEEIELSKDANEKRVVVFDEIVDINKAYNDEQIKQNKIGLLEGDIEIVDIPENLSGSFSQSIDGKLLKRSLVRHQEYLWVDRVIPYEIDQKIAHREGEIINALKIIKENSCISFVKRTNETNWIKFLDRGGCFSAVGRVFWHEGSQEISLGKNCFNTGTIIHEVLHALGFYHEQSRTDRSNYVEIFWENIDESNIHNFEKYEAADVRGTDYDFESVMHYGKKSFSKNGKDTIRRIGSNNNLGQRHGLSSEDIVKLNKLYMCQDVRKIYTEWSEWSPCKSTCNKDRQRFCSNYNAKKCPEANVYGVHTEIGTCTPEECSKPVDGHWNRWGAWTDCSVTCGNGTRTRTRECTDPAPRHSGKVCVGSPTQSRDCFIKTKLSPDDCDFKDGLCNWKSTVSSYYKWEEINGKTPSSGTGPDGDHTSKDGNYIYAESSGVHKEEKTSLISNLYKPSKNRCMTFFYSMHGVGIGALRVFVRPEDLSVEDKVWELIGPQGEGWKEAQVDITSEYSYQIRFEAERGGSYKGDIALDDISFRDGKCSENFIIISSCGKRMRPLGCYADNSNPHLMGPSVYSGRSKIDWKNYLSFLKTFASNCIKETGTKYVGFQYYGECYGSNEPVYNNLGESKSCINPSFGKCITTDTKEICMGTVNENYIYEILD